MPQPTPSDVHVNGPLTNIAVAYQQDADAFIASRAFPVVPVQKQSDVYFEYTKEDWYRDEAKVRAPSTESAGGGFTVTTKPYNCVVKAYHKDIDDQVRANADAPLDLDAAATRFVTTKMLISLEKAWMTAFFASGIWGTDVTPGTLWSAANSTPGPDLETGKSKILSTTGYQANTLILGYPVFAALRQNSAVKDQFKYTSADSINEAMLANFFDIERILVARSVTTTTVEGAATQTTDLLAGKNALLCYSAPAPSLLEPTAGYTFAWSGYVGAANGIRILRYRMDPIRSDRVEGESAFQCLKVAAGLGYFFANVVS